MAVIFNQDKLGLAVGIRLAGTAPTGRIALDVDSPTASSYSVTGRFTGNWDRLVDWVSNSTAGDLYRDAATYLWGGPSEPPKSPPRIAQDQSEYEHGSDSTRAYTDRSKKTLFDLLQGLGFVTGVSVSFNDNYDPTKASVEVGAASLGSGTIDGVVFDNTCNAASAPASTETSSIGNGNMQWGETRSGLEPLLEFYWYHRSSRTVSEKSEVLPVILKIGATKIKAYVVGLTFSPLNLDYRIWTWSFKLAIDPRYDIQPLSVAQQDVTGRSIRGLTQI